MQCNSQQQLLKIQIPKANLRPTERPPVIPDTVSHAPSMCHKFEHAGVGEQRRAGKMGGRQGQNEGEASEALSSGVKLNVCLFV